MGLSGHPDQVKFHWSPEFFPRTIPDVIVSHLSTGGMTSSESPPPALLTVIFVTVFLADGLGVRACVSEGCGGLVSIEDVVSYEFGFSHACSRPELLLSSLVKAFHRMLCPRPGDLLPCMAPSPALHPRSQG